MTFALSICWNPKPALSVLGTMETLTQPNLKAHVVTTTPPRIAGKEVITKRWAVLARSAEEAEDIVRERVAAECLVQVTDEILDQDKVIAIGLQPGHATAV